MKPLSVVELIARYRALQSALEALPANPTRDGAALVFQYADEAAQLAERTRETFLAFPDAAEVEIDELHAAMSDASGVLQRRFSAFVAPRLS